MKRSMILLGIMAFIVSIMITLFVFPRQLVIKIPQVQIQEKIETEFPIETELLFLKAQLKNPTIDLDQSTERIILNLDTAVQLDSVIASGELPGLVSLSSGINYQSDQGTIYLDDIKIEHIDLNALPQPIITRVNSIINIISSDVMTSVPIYTLDSDKFKQRSIKWILKDVAIADQELIVILGR